MNHARKTTQLDTPIFTGGQTTQKALQGLANDMLAVWPKEFVLRREIPLFTCFLLSNADLEKLGALSRAPAPSSEADGEFVYNKEALARWYVEIGHLGERIGSLHSSSRIPGCWFVEGRPSPELNPYEVMLHRHAEKGCLIAREQVGLTVKWDAPFVAICDIEEFCAGAINEEALLRLLNLRLNGEEELPSADSLYEKWELAFFLYSLADSTPRARFVIAGDHVSMNGEYGGPMRTGSIATGYEKLAMRLGTNAETLKRQSTFSAALLAQLDDDEFAAALDLRGAARQQDFGKTEVFDHYEFQTWLQHIIGILPMPIRLA